jgi:hypothetical protein
MMRSRIWRRHGWKVLLFLTSVIGLFGLGDIVFGADTERLPVTGLTLEEIRATSEPLARNIEVLEQVGGLHLIVMSLLWAVMLLIPFRRGERWAWYAMWTFPLWGVAVAVSWLFVERQPGAPLPPPAISGWLFFGLTAALLWASRGAIHRPEDADTTERSPEPSRKQR